MDCKGSVYPPELIELMKGVLDDAMAALPEAKRTSVHQADMACAILREAGNGERNPVVLKAVAVGSVVECSRYWHDISPERRVV
jgi:hypothetical protein